MEAYDGPQIVGMDLHRRRSVLVRMTEDGRKLATVRITNNPVRLAAVGAEVHLAHPPGVKAFSHRRVKNDLLTELARQFPWSSDR